MLLNRIQKSIWNIWQLFFYYDITITLMFIIFAFSVLETPKQMACNEVSKRFWPSCLCRSWTSWRERRFYCIRAVLKFLERNSTSAGLQVLRLKFCLYLSDKQTHTHKGALSCCSPKETRFLDNPSPGRVKETLDLYKRPLTTEYRIP